ncbi:MAG TPA: GNAT family N-acetyltransferase [Herpetosiphonaceae bacterium]
MTIAIRPLDTSIDYPRLAELLSLVNSDAVTAEQLREWDTSVPADIARVRLMAEQDGEVVGYGGSRQIHWGDGRDFWMTLVVYPERRGRGAGSALIERLAEFCQCEQANDVTVDVRDNDPASLRFGERHGFAVSQHYFESSLDVAGFPLEEWEPLIGRAEAAGIRFFTWAEAGDTPENRRKLHEIHRHASVDQPDSDGEFPGVEELCDDLFKQAWYEPEGHLLAADGDEWVGVSLLGKPSPTHSMYLPLTGVHASHCGRKIAQALKVWGVRLARERGVTRIHTHNNAKNAPMLAINQRLGFQPEPGLYRLLRNFSAPR